MQKFFTIGHSTRSAAEFIGMLTALGTTRVVDVRRFPHSRRHPHFDGSVLSAALEAESVAYLHLPDLGGRRGASAVPEALNAFWRNKSFHSYADHAMGPPFQEALQQLLALGVHDTCAIMCAEAVWWRCHRRIITDYLLFHGAPVTHVIAERRSDRARMTPAARPTEDGVLCYPASADHAGC